MLKKIGWTLLIALIAIQFIRPAQNQTTAPQPNAIQTKFSVSEPVASILQKACKDCHSNNTNYPWYSNIQPVYWWLNDHIQEGKRELNFDEYTNKRLRYQYHKMEEVIEQVKEGEMPLNSYTWTHADARLTKEEKTILTQWAQDVMDTLKTNHPLDSLIRPKKPTQPKTTSNETAEPRPDADDRRERPGTN